MNMSDKNQDPNFSEKDEFYEGFTQTSAELLAKAFSKMTGKASKETGEYLNKINALNKLLEIYPSVLKKALEIDSSELKAEKPEDQESQLTVAGLFWEKQRKNSAIAFIVLLLPLIVLFLAFLLGLPVNLQSFWFVLVFVGLILMRQLLINYRIKKGYFGNTIYEARQLIEFVGSMEDDLGPPGGGSDTKIFPELSAETMSEKGTDYGLAGETA